MNATIPVYRADGRLYDHVTERGLARLQEAGLIARVVRHRKGHINRAILFVRPGEAPMPRTAYMGTAARVGARTMRPTTCGPSFCKW
jgi:hypothetical protein